MITKKNLLVFPCGSEVALEIFRSLEYSIHINLFGASSEENHGKFVYKNYIGNLPFINEGSFISEMKFIVEKFNIHVIYPAMDSVISILKENEIILGCKVIASDIATTKICLSKSKTYEYLKGIVNVPFKYNNLEDEFSYPIFIKPDVGYGSRGVLKATNIIQAEQHLIKYPDSILLEYLPGNEYTVDCFSNFKGELLFIGPRGRNRISNGISVNSKSINNIDRFNFIAQKINNKIKFNGAWFFQVKERIDGVLVLMEIASRMGGSYSVNRAKGINFALMSVFNIFEIPVEVLVNDYDVELDRALDNKFKINIKFSHVYIDLDDTILINGKINIKLIAGIYGFINENKKIYLITKHAKNINETLLKYKINNLFDEIIHLKPEQSKSDFIKFKDAIFIDDSFSERKNIYKTLNIPVFSPENIECITNI